MKLSAEMIHVVRKGQKGLLSSQSANENCVNTYSCFLTRPIDHGKPSSYEEERRVGKILSRSSPRDIQKLRLSSSATSLGQLSKNHSKGRVKNIKDFLDIIDVLVKVSRIAQDNHF